MINKYIVISCLVIVTILTSRPSLLGQDYTYISFIACLLFFLILIYSDYKKIHIDIVYFILFTFFWVSIFITALVFDKSDFLIILKTFLSFFLVNLVIIISMKDHIVRKRVFGFFTYYISLSGYSALITFFIYSVLGYHDILITKLTIDGYSKAGLIYYPFSVSSGEFNVAGFTFLRFNSFIREPGIFQAIAILFYFYSKVFYETFKFLSVGCLLAIILTFSTTGLVLFLISYGLFVFYKSQHKLRALFKVTIYFIIGVISFLYAPYFGYFDKVKTHGSSITDRSSSIYNSLDLIQNNPFGLGYRSLDYINNSNISLISSLGQIGIISFLFLMLIYLYPILKLSQSKITLYFTLTCPVFLTLMFSQPIYDNPSTWFYFLGSYFILKSNENEKNISYNN